MKIVLSLLLFAGLSQAHGQSWELVRNEDGIRIYTASIPGRNIHQYKALTFFPTDLDHALELVADYSANQHLFERLKHIEFLLHKRHELYINHMIFDLPWPLQDRDMVVRTQVRQAPGEIILESDLVNGYVGLQDGMVRITDLQERWTLREHEDGTTVEVVGHADPGGMIPSWIANLFITREPYNFLHGIRERAR